MVLCTFEIWFWYNLIVYALWKLNTHKTAIELLQCFACTWLLFWIKIIAVISMYIVQGTTCVSFRLKMTLIKLCRVQVFRKWRFIWRWRCSLYRVKRPISMCILTFWPLFRPITPLWETSDMWQTIHLWNPNEQTTNRMTCFSTWIKLSWFYYPLYRVSQKSRPLFDALYLQI